MLGLGYTCTTLNADAEIADVHVSYSESKIFTLQTTNPYTEISYIENVKVGLVILKTDLKDIDIELYHRSSGA